MSKAKSDDKVLVENINVPGRIDQLCRTKYSAMREAMLAILPHHEPGMTLPAAKAALLSHLSEGLFLPVSTDGWWLFNWTWRQSR